jgi:hypothetical protein
VFLCEWDLDVMYYVMMVFVYLIIWVIFFSGLVCVIVRLLFYVSLYAVNVRDIS